MQVKHAETGKLVEVKPGDIVRALGVTKSVEVGRVVAVELVVPARSSAGNREQLVVSWFGVGTGSGWLSTDVEVVQTAEERAGLVAAGVAQFFRSARRTKAEIQAGGLGLNGLEQYAVRNIARELRVSYFELCRAINGAVGAKS